MNTILEMPNFFIGAMTVRIGKQNQNISVILKVFLLKTQKNWLAVRTAQPRISKGRTFMYIMYNFGQGS